ELSSPLDGIRFNIKGHNDDNRLRQISWPIDDSMAYIALPDSRGRVESIDQLFGDNTLGPDGKFSRDGYHALSKYDLNDDEQIDQDDGVFSKLRLFFDRNRNGRADSGELVSLKRAGITSVDLRFDPRYKEKDIYGNKILYKSVADSEDGMLLVFDIWFRHID
ncbi:MAG: hypothetical protein AAF202_09050, partial [Pseudomonadota bacterium]